MEGEWILITNMILSTAYIVANNVPKSVGSMI